MAVIIGTGSNDFLVGTEDPDLIRGLFGDDFVSGGGGNDEIEGNEGNDTLRGSAGDDLIYGGDGNDTIIEDFQGANERLYGEAGDDWLRYVGFSPTGATLVALLDGGTGNDLIELFASQATTSASLIGGAGSDRILADAAGGAITIDAGADSDFVQVSARFSDYDVTLGSGSDLLLLETDQFWPNTDTTVTVSDFAAGDGGDSLSLVTYLARQASNWSFADNPFASGHLRLVQDGADVRLQVDRDGVGAAHVFRDLVVLENVSAAALTARNLGGYAQDGSAAPGQQIDGTAAGDNVSATSGDDEISGLGGNDTLFGGAGDDELLGGEGDDRIRGELGDDLLYGGAGNDTLREELGGSDELYGEAGNDSLFVDRQWFVVAATASLLDGGADQDALSFLGRVGFDDATLIGGGGNDSISTYGGRDVIIDAGSGNDFVTFDIGAASLEITLGTGMDLIQPTTFQLPLVGFTVLDFEVGNAGDRIYLIPVLAPLLSGWNVGSNPFAADYLRLGQRGSDTVLLYDSSGEDRFYKLLGEFENVSAAQFTEFNLGFMPAGPIAIVGTDSADTLNGGAGDDEILGFAGGDVITGGGGADRMIGGLGDDRYSVDTASDRVLEGIGEGYDRVLAAASFALEAGSHIEMLTTDDNFGTAAIDLTGNALTQYIYGNAGANTLDGGGGGDVMYGFEGDDRFVIRSAADRVVELASGGSDRVLAATSFVLEPGSEVEMITTIDNLATTAINLTGNGLAQYLYGNAGSNRLDGGGGGDVMYGFEGNDFFTVRNASDRVVEAAGGGTDRVFAGASFTLEAGSEVEMFTTVDNLATTTIDLTGNALSQYLYGNAGVNVIDGGGGGDVMYGFEGNDFFITRDASDRVVEFIGGGNDRVFAGASFTLEAGSEIELLTTVDNLATTAINLSGNALAQYLYGNAGANTLDGKAGADVMTGLGGADNFAFTSVLGGGNIDRIADFSAADDTILLDDAVFAGLALGALNANAFVVGSQAADASDRIIYNQATGQLFFDADGTGVGAAVHFATLDGAPIISASDFTVI